MTHTPSIDETTGRLEKTLWRPILLLEPERLVHPPSWLEHVPFAFWLMDVLRPRLFVELGSHSGNSYAALAQAAQHLGLRTAGYAIDTWKGDAQAGFYPEAVYQDFKAWHDRRFASFSTLVRSTFDDALGHFEDGSVDLLNIDGYHTFEAAAHDLETWLPKVSSRGVVLMHDVNVRERDFGAWKAWEQASGRYPHFQFLHGHGLGVLGVGPDLPPQIRELFALSARDDEGTAVVRRFFARHGAVVADQYRALTADRDAREREVQRALAEERGTTIGALGARLQEAERARAAYEARAADLAARLTAVDAQAADLRARVESLETTAGAEHDRAAAAEAEAGRLSADRDRRLATAAADLAAERAARAAAVAATRLATLALDGAREQLAGVSARLQRIVGRGADADGPAGGRLNRVWAALRALELTPGQVVRRPRRLGSWWRVVRQPRLLRQALMVTNSGLFDAAFYRAANPDVAAGGGNPLLHFLTAGGREGRSPHRLFDGGWYRTANADVAGSGANPLVHYLIAGAREGRDPHPLFASAWYLQRIGQTPGTVNALQHYVSHGAVEGRSPHPLFDPGYYVERYGGLIGDLDPFVHFVMAAGAEVLSPHPLFDAGGYQRRAPELAGTGQNPLVHYLQTGFARGLRPHPLFDPTFYLTRYRDVAADGSEPLTHFVVSGGREGRAPIPEFDAAWYLATYPDVAATGMNPLEHYVRTGWLEGRSPSPSFDSPSYVRRYPDVLDSAAPPLLHFLEHGRAEGRRTLPDPVPAAQPPQPIVTPLRLAATNLGRTQAPTGRIVVCLTHVMPVRPRAGNEYRIHRLLRWLADSGHTVIPIVAPNDGSRPGADEVREIAAAFGNAVLCLPDGRVEYLLRDVPDVLGSMDGLVTPRRPIPGEADAAEDEERMLLQMDRSFCTDTLIEVLLRLESVLPPHVLLAEYIWMSRVLPLLRRDVFKVIDTIDVFSTRAEKVEQFGISDLLISPDAERQRLIRADLLVAIQANERRELEALAPGLPVVTSGVDFDVVAACEAPRGRQVLCVASGNPMNRRGLRDFVRHAWPRVRARVRDATLLVAGDVGQALPVPPDGVSVLGRVADLEPLYAAARAVINPAAAGTGVKIKTLEALAHLRRIVTWPNGVDGLSPGLSSLCLVAEDWVSFADTLSELLERDDPAFTVADRAVLAREASPAHVYAELGQAIDGYFERVALR